jgi:hypothetical protein
MAEDTGKSKHSYSNLLYFFHLMGNVPKTRELKQFAEGH